MLWIRIGAVSAFTTVLLGSFGAHAWKEILGDYGRELFHTAYQYQFAHALTLILLGAIPADRLRLKPKRWAGWLFTSGTVLFSGSLYILALSGERWLGMITPLGGLAFLGGWVALFLSSTRA